VHCSLHVVFPTRSDLEHGTSGTSQGPGTSSIAASAQDALPSPLSESKGVGRTVAITTLRERIRGKEGRSNDGEEMKHKVGQGISNVHPLLAARC
jgi:hypothetical protein